MQPCVGTAIVFTFFFFDDEQKRYGTIMETEVTVNLLLCSQAINKLLLCQQSLLLHSSLSPSFFPFSFITSFLVILSFLIGLFC